MYKSLFTLLVLFATIVSCTTSAKRETINASEVKKESELPNLIFTNVDGTQTSAKTLLGKKVLIILFQPDCDHCQRESKQIQEQLPAFKDYTLYFISSAPAVEIKKFSEDYKLSNEGNVHFAATDVQGILNSFGAIPAPSLYIYTEDGTLKSKFNGETEVDKVISQL
jgi:peroxiredoxin